jgi:hypothetical protein
MARVIGSSIPRIAVGASRAYTLLVMQMSDAIPHVVISELGAEGKIERDNRAAADQALRKIRFAVSVGHRARRKSDRCVRVCRHRVMDADGGADTPACAARAGRNRDVGWVPAGRLPRDLCRLADRADGVAHRLDTRARRPGRAGLVDDRTDRSAGLSAFIAGSVEAFYGAFESAATWGTCGCVSSCRPLRGTSSEASSSSRS